MKCPACGFETPDTQAWCDFCKEPFRKKQDPAKNQESVKLPSKIPQVSQDKPMISSTGKTPVPAHLLEKLQRQKEEYELTLSLPADVLARFKAEQDKAQGIAPKLPSDFINLDTGGKIPQVPSQVRGLAYLFLGICILWIFIGTVWLFFRAQKIKEGRLEPQVRSEMVV